MIDTITLTGIVATDPRHTVTAEGLAITSFRLASGQRRFDRPTNSWVDTGTNWYGVSTFQLLARNVAHSVRKGQHVMLTGRLRQRDWTSGDRVGMSVEVTAETLGHDLNWYVTTAIRTGMTSQTPPPSTVTSEGAPDTRGVSGAAVSDAPVGSTPAGTVVASAVSDAAGRSESDGAVNPSDAPALAP